MCNTKDSCCKQSTLEGRGVAVVTLSPSSLSGQGCRLMLCSLACKGDTEASLVSMSSN